MRRSVISALVATLVITACGGSSGLESKLKLSEDPASALLIVKDEGGFAPIEFLVTQGPRFVLLRDGSLITAGPQLAMYPGPLLASYQQHTLDDEMMLFVLEELDAIDFASIQNEVNDEATNTVADASTTVVTFFNQDGTHTFAVYGLGVGFQVSDARVGILANLIDRVGQLGFAGAGSVYPYSDIQVLAGVSEFPPEPAVANTQSWPLPIPFEQMGDVTGFGWRCATYTGVEAQGLLEVFGQANQATLWDDETAEYQIAVRPIFPGEAGCAAIPAAG